MKIRENQLARDIVANLGWRWLESRRVLRTLEPSKNWEMIDFAHGMETADWNAFEVSRRILYGNII